ncbi:MAG: hypothetical protein QXT31_03475 [Candidatus Bathyarchaeia archaeon]
MNTIIAHGDLDGIISAALLLKAKRLNDYNVIFTEPFLLDKIKVPENDNIFIVDIAINNKNPNMTLNFINTYKTQISKWYDHHQGWKNYKLSESFIIDETKQSCASIIGGDPELVEAATIADTRQGELLEKFKILEDAIKSNPQDDSTRHQVLAFLLGDESMFPLLKQKAEKYAEVKQTTEEVAKNYVVSGNVAYVDATFKEVDITALLLAGEKLAKFAVVKHNQNGEVVYTVATLSKVNLLEIFGLKSGAKFRVTLPSSTDLEELLKKLNAV